MVNIYIDGQLIDQFKDENVEIISQVLDVSDITKAKGDYSKTFTVPASKKNNKIFKHWYNASIDGGFDARVKVDGKIDIDGIPFKTGKFLLRSAKINDGIITSYTINFFGNFTSLKDTIGEDELTDLDFSSYDHDYTDDDVINKLKVNYSNTYPEVIYTPTAKKRYIYNSEALEDAGDYADEVLAQEESNIHNIAFPSGGIVTENNYHEPANNAIGIQWNDLHPSLRCDTIIDAIEAKYTKANGYTSDIKFSRDFFDTTEFNRLYMLLSSKNDRPMLKPNETPQDILSSLNYNGGGIVSTDTTAYTGGPTVVQEGGDVMLFNLADGYGFHSEMWCNRQSIVGTSNVTVRFEMNIDSQGWNTVQEVSGSTFKGGVGVSSTTLKTDWHKYTNNSGSNQVIQARYYVDVEGSATIHCRQQYRMGIPTPERFSDKRYVYSTAVSGNELEINNNLPKIKVIDFLKGIFQMFKLVIVPLEDGTFYVNTLNSYYAQGKEYEVSRYIDRSSLKVSRGDVISSLDMKFKKSDTVLSDEFFNRNKRGYGDKKIRFENEFGELLEGNDLEIELPFEQVVYERPNDVHDGFNTRLQLPHLINRENKPVNPETVLHYVNGLSQIVKPIMVLRDASGTSRYHKVDDVIYVASHHPSLYNPFTSLLFKDEYSIFNSAILTNTLYTNHYNNYVSAVSDIGRRNYKYTAKLPTITSANLKLNDVITIDGYSYRINKYKYNLLTGLSDLELVNKIDTSLSPFNGAPSVLRVGYEGDTFSFNLPNADDYTITELDLGDGTNWTSISTSFDANSRGVYLPANRFNVTVSQNLVTGGDNRRVKIEFELNGVTTSMIIIQDEADDNMGSVVQQRLTGLNLLPASGNYIYDTTLVTKTFVGSGGDPDTVESVNTYNGDDTISDAEIALDRMQAEFPNLESLAVIVTWYGDTDNPDMVIKPRLDIDTGTPVYNVPYVVGSYDRTNTPNVTLDSNGDPNQGGTPGDAGVLEFVAACNTRGIKVMLYPFLQMDTPNKGWRGLIPFTSKAEVDTWWTQYEPFIRHYSQLFASEGVALDKFMIGTELVTLTRYNDNDQYFGVQHLVQLAEDVRNDFGSSNPVQISYGANWDEYHSHDSNYHMDELWTSPNIDAVGIDNYFPATDFQDPSTVTLQNIIDGYESGEGWDHYYSVYSNDPATMLASKVDYPVAGGEFAWKNCFGWWDRDHTAHSYTVTGAPVLGSELLTSADFSSIAFPWNYGTWSYIPSPTVSGGIATLPISGGDYPTVNPRIEQEIVTISGEVYTVEVDVNDAGGIPIQVLTVDPNNGFAYLNGDTDTFATNGIITYDFTATSAASTLQILVQGVDGDSVELNSASIKQQIAGSGSTVTNTAWTARQKPLFFSEYGFASVNGTTNQPNVFSPDLPRLSDGTTDNDIQLKGLIAFNEYWDVKTSGISGFAEDRFAWAYDIRPYPQYPFGGIWADSSDWEKGHWLNGKL